MSQQVDSGHHRICADREVSPERRRVLKVAAATAPLIATLPSGGALANASVNQCIIDSQQESTDNAGVADFLASLETDRWVRKQVGGSKFTDGDNEQFWLQLDASTTSSWYPVSVIDTAGNTLDVQRPWTREESGDTVTFREENGIASVDYRIAEGNWSEYPQDYYVLAIFEVVENAGNPMGPVDAVFLGLAPANIPEYPGQTALTGSCACSVDPGILNDGISGMSMC